MSYNLSNKVSHSIYGDVYHDITKNVIIKKSEISYGFKNTTEDVIKEQGILRYISKLSAKDCFVKLIDSYRKDGYNYTILNYCGTELFKRILREPSEARPSEAKPSVEIREANPKGVFQTFLSIDDRIKIIYQIVDIVKELRRLGIAHLDISPENFCIDDKGIVRIIDFGLAEVHGLYFPQEFDEYVQYNKLITNTSDILHFKCNIPDNLGGKKKYMAPEMFHNYHKGGTTGEKKDSYGNTSYIFDAFKCDLYALGTTLYAVLTGCQAYNSFDDIWFKILYSGDWLLPDVYKTIPYKVKYPRWILEYIDQYIKPSDNRVFIDIEEFKE